MLLALAQPADATVITRTFNFTASGFGAGAPVDPVIGSATVTWNNAANVPETTAGITLNSLNLTLGSVIGFYYGVSDDTLRIGGIQTGVLGIASDTNDFFMIIGNASGSPPLSGLNYTQTTTRIFYASSSTVTLGAAVPEPMTLALLAPALLGLGAIRARRRAA